MKSGDFDKIAFIYDRLATLIFGKSISDSQKYFLSRIPDHSKVLILGGGTGWILEELFATKPNLGVCYIEASAKMMDLAKAKLHEDKRVQFILGTETDIPDRSFDVVITNFYLDLFKEGSLRNALEKIKRSITPKALWIVTEFGDHTWWHKVLLKMMYLFFQFVCNIEANRLPNWNKAMQELGGIKSESKSFYRNFIEATVFQF